MAIVSGSRALTAADHGKMLLVGDDCTLTLPTGLPTGFFCVVFLQGAGKTITYTAGGGVTLQSDGVSQTAQYKTVTVCHLGGNIFAAYGDLA